MKFKIRRTIKGPKDYEMLWWTRINGQICCLFYDFNRRDKNLFSAARSLKKSFLEFAFKEMYDHGQGD